MEIVLIVILLVIIVELCLIFIKLFKINSIINLIYQALFHKRNGDGLGLETPYFELLVRQIEELENIKKELEK